MAFYYFYFYDITTFSLLISNGDKLNIEVRLYKLPLGVFDDHMQIEGVPYSYARRVSKLRDYWITRNRTNVP